VLRRLAKVTVVAAALLAACTTPQQPPPAVPTILPSQARSPFREPPGVFSTDVTQANISVTICVSGWTATVRPPTSYTQALKRTMLTRAGLDPNTAIAYELDHFVPLAIGGHPRSEDNLWLQRWDGEWSVKFNDRLER